MNTHDFLTEEDEQHLRDSVARAILCNGTKKEFKRAVSRSIIKISTATRERTKEKIDVAHKLIDRYWKDAMRDKNV